MPRPGPSRRRRGLVVAAVVISLAVLVAMAGFAIDIGLVVLACQKCQFAADAGCLAGSQELRTPSQAISLGHDFALENVPAAAADEYSADVEYYAPGTTIPGVGVAGTAGALRVTVNKRVDYLFLRAVGLTGTTVSRSAYSTTVVTGTCIVPMWIWHTTPVSYGVQIQLLMADGPHCGIPGSFGFLQPMGGVSFDSLMRGTATLAEEELQRVEIDDIVWAKPGLAVAHWRNPLKTDSDSRLNRSTWSPWTADTFSSFHADNPRILIVPMVEYIDGTGSNARFYIRNFGAFWLEDVITNGSNRKILGRFIDFSKPGGTRYGLRPTRLIH